MPLPPPPPQSSHSASIFRNNLNGEDAYTRHQRYVKSARLYGESKGDNSTISGRTEFQALKEAHQFLRDDEENPENLSWDDQLAVKYYNGLFKEYAICDLKHYKTGNIALRWRTEDEVVSGAGQFTCANPRCAYHSTTVLDDSHPMPKLITLELPFAYEEHGEKKSALVKAVLCPRCKRKLTWKRDKEKGARDMEHEDRGSNDPAQNHTLTEPRSRTRDPHGEKKSRKSLNGHKDDPRPDRSRTGRQSDRRSASPIHRQRRRSTSQ